MTASPSSPARPPHLARKLDRHSTLRADEKSALINAITSMRCHGPHEEIVLKGEVSGACTVLLNGMALAYDVRLDGRRQVVAIHIPGDICDLSTFVLRQAHCNITTLTPCTVGIIPHTALRDLIERHPRIASMLWRETAAMDAIRSAWISVLGSRSASERLCHLFCELLIRLQRLGLAEDKAFHLPFTQPDLANILGISTVHVNRVLKELRREHLVTVDRHGYVLVHSWQRLQNRAEFDPVYLKES
jgi:CRP-like cAMP-binding protein